MPLSEDEQRILRQIEEQLQRDPGFGRNLHHGTHGNRRVLIGSGIAAVLCLVLTVGLLSVSPYLSFVAFVGALASALVCERHARSLGEAGIGHLSETVRGRFGQATQHRADD
jgi:amino acid permease